MRSSSDILEMKFEGIASLSFVHERNGASWFFLWSCQIVYASEYDIGYFLLQDI